MAFEEGGTFQRFTEVAVSDLSSKQYYAVTVVAAGMDIATPAKAIDGILQGNPAAGVAGPYQRAGISKAAISASQALTKGITLLEVDTAGTFKALASGIAVAKAMETLASTASVCIIAVELLPSNAAQA